MVTNTTAVAEVMDNGELRDRLGRTITPVSRRAELVAAWRESGMTFTTYRLGAESSLNPPQNLAR